MRNNRARQIAIGRRSRALIVAAAGVSLLFGPSACTGGQRSLHYASNGNFGAGNTYLPGKAGFNLADVETEKQLDSLPLGVKGLVWVGQCQGVDSRFLQLVQPFIGHPKLFGFYLMDDPDPTGWYAHPCKARNLKAESDWIHAHAPGAKTFIVLMDLSRSGKPSFAGTYNPENSHIDLFGIDPYPCRTELGGCRYDMIDHYVAAAKAWGIPRSRMVPVYQAFGGGKWRDDGWGKYLLPSAAQERQILARWGKLVPSPAFDFAYSWGRQENDASLEAAPDLQAVFAAHNNAASP